MKKSNIEEDKNDEIDQITPKLTGQQRPEKIDLGQAYILKNKALSLKYTDRAFCCFGKKLPGDDSGKKVQYKRGILLAKYQVRKCKIINQDLKKGIQKSP